MWRALKNIFKDIWNYTLSPSYVNHLCKLTKEFKPSKLQIFKETKPDTYSAHFNDSDFPEGTLMFPDPPRKGKRHVAEGSFGKIYHGVFVYGNGYKAKVAIKVPIKTKNKKEIRNFYYEIKFQLLIGCKLRSLPARKHFPAILGAGKIQNSYNTRSSVPCVIMTRLGKDGWTHLDEAQDRNSKISIFKKMCIDVSSGLIYLQDQFQFEHRDLHLGNIMDADGRFVIMDFGMSKAVIDGKAVFGSADGGNYDEEKPDELADFNPDHDMLMLVQSFIVEFVCDYDVRSLPPYLYKILRRRMKNLGQKINSRDKKLCSKIEKFFHYSEAYSETVNIRFSPTNPRNLQKAALNDFRVSS